MPDTAQRDEPAERYRHFYDQRPARYRSEGQRDRDRVLYSSAFRRLAEVTQVVAPTEGHVFHNRLTHTLEVAQIGRRLAEKLIDPDASPCCVAIAQELGGVDPDVVETAALVHDLGHPPFGHVAEKELDRLMRAGSDADGYEGNAQSFRIATHLEVQKESVQQGLDLTRASLAASLKYPWMRPDKPEAQLSSIQRGHQTKWGAYRTETEIFDWVRLGRRKNDYSRSPEAEIMDWADDVAYSVHDVEDFFRAGLVPLDRIITNYSGERDWFFSRVFPTEPEDKEDRKRARGLKRAFLKLIYGLERIGVQPPRPYRDHRDQRVLLNELKSFLIGRYIDGVSLARFRAGPRGNLRIPAPLEREVHMLKQLVWVYVINNPALATQQTGQVRAIRTLFLSFERFSRKRSDWTKFPERFREQLEAIREGDSADTRARRRIVADLVASMTERQALTMYQRLLATSPGSALDRLL